MPAYFFHLAFELYPSPSSPPNTTTYTPPPQTDIFSAELPSHNSTPWSAFPARPQHHTASPIASSSDLNRHRHSGVYDRPHHSRRHSHHRPSRLSFSERNGSPAPTAKVASNRPRPQPVVHQDWRFDTISILSIDMKPTDADPARPRAKSLKHPSTSSSTGGLATKGRYIPSDPKDTEVGWGVVHLYRDGQETPGLYDESPGADFDQNDCTTLCILAVPSYMTPSDLLGFVGEETREDVSHFRLIRTARANKYMVLMKFREANKARDWRKEWNGKAFNSMEPEYCHVVFIKSITFQSDSSHRDPSSYPNLTNDPFTPTPSKQPTAPLPAASATSPTVEHSSIPSSLTAKPLAPPTPSLVELPTCPVCLERMDETTGLLTILCQHVFHCACLEKWRGSGCPVCRYTQNDALTSSSYMRSGGDDLPENECSVCGLTQNLWICLICGNTGCGRYDSAHAFAHYEATNHSYAMDVVTQHVWDYAGDGYVHRLIQNKADGKLVDLPLASSAAHDNHNNMTGYANDTVPREKVDSMGMEYAYLLTSQLESQRLYFEEQVERAVDKAAKASSAVESLTTTLTSLTAQLDALTTQHTQTTASLAGLEKSSARTESKLANAQSLARSLTKQLKEEQIVNESLLSRIAHLEAQKTDVETRLRAVETEKADLQEQNRDLSFFIAGQERLAEMKGSEVLGLGEGEVEAGFVELGTGTAGASGDGGGGTGGGGKGDGAGKGRRKGKGKGKKR